MRGPPSPEVTGAFCRVPSTQFSQAPWYTLPVHLCRFRVRSSCRGCFLEQIRRTHNPISRYDLLHSSHPGRFRNINLIPIDYAFRPRLRGRLTLRGLALRRNPWTFGESVSHTLYRYSCQHSRFRYLQGTSRIPLHRPTERSATTQMPDDRHQGSEDFRRSRLDSKPCSILAISWYSSRQRRQVGSSIYSRSRQYLAQTLISSAEPIAIFK